MLFKHGQRLWMKDKRLHSLAQSRSEDAPGHERAGRRPSSPSHVINAPCVFLSPSALRCHAPWRWGSLSVLIRIHGCQDLSPGQFSLLCSSASLTGYWSGPISSLLRRPTCPELQRALESLIFMKSQGHHEDVLLTAYLALGSSSWCCRWCFLSSQWPVSESVLPFQYCSH